MKPKPLSFRNDLTLPFNIRTSVELVDSRLALLEVNIVALCRSAKKSDEPLVLTTEVAAEGPMLSKWA